MRPDTSTPIQAGADQTHTTVLRGPHPIAFNPRTDLEAIGTLVRALHQTHRIAKLKARQLRLLLTLAALTNGKHFRETGELVSWPGEVALADALGLKRSSNVYRMVEELRAAELIERSRVNVDGATRWVYRLLFPEPSSDGASPAAGTVRTRRGMTGRARPNWARAQGGPADPSARPNWRGARAQIGRARQARATNTLTRASETAKNETAKSSSSITPRAESAPPPDGRVAAAAAALEGLGIEPRTIAELVAIESVTRELVIAWTIEGAKGHIRNKAGFVVAKLRGGARPPFKALARARAQLARHDAPARAEPATPDHEALTHGMAKMRAALARAKAEKDV